MLENTIPFSFETFLVGLAIHKIPVEIIKMFEMDYHRAFPREMDRTLEEWAIIFEEWGKIVKEDLATQLLEQFNSDSKH